MPQSAPNDDLFEGTTMSFGEHLEELRVSLVRALVGLVIGFLIGLAVAHFVVAFIQTPLRRALEKHYITQSVGKLTENLAEEDPELVASQEFKDVEDFMRREKYVFENIYIEAAELARVGAIASDPTAASEDSTAFDKDVILPLPTTRMLKTRVWRPLNTKVQTLNPQEAFMIWLKAAVVSGLVIAGPWIFAQLWLFVAAGLYPHEKKYVYLYLPFSFLLFLAGASTAFFFVFDPVLEFLFSFNAWLNIDVDPRISEWISFVLFIPLGFGIAFQLPLVMLFLQRIGIFQTEAYTSKWRIAILVIFVISMLLTPADPISMMLMAVPLTFLYFMGILLCHWMPRGRNPFADEVYEP